MSERMLGREAYLSLKAATRLLVKSNGTGEQAEAVTRLDQTNLSRAGLNHLEDRFLPIDVVADLEEASGEPIVTRALARLSGCVLLEPPAAGAGDPLARGVGISAQRFGELMANYGQASADQVIDRAEAAQIEADAGRMIAALWQVMQIARREAGK